MALLEPEHPKLLILLSVFPQSLQSTSLSPAVNTSHIQRTEEELNYSELNLGCIISSYKLSRILFILIKSVQLLICI